MRRATRIVLRSLIASLFLTCALSGRSDAGPIWDAVGKGLDKAAGVIVKAHEKLEPLKPKGKLVKGATQKVGETVKQAKGGLAGLKGNSRSCGCK